MVVARLLERLRLLTWSLVFHSQSFDVSTDATLSSDTNPRSDPNPDGSICSPALLPALIPVCSSPGLNPDPCPAPMFSLL